VRSDPASELAGASFIDRHCDRIGISDEQSRQRYRRMHEQLFGDIRQWDCRYSNCHSQYWFYFHGMVRGRMHRYRNVFDNHRFVDCPNHGYGDFQPINRCHLTGRRCSSAETIRKFSTMG
jgi:hypothetical protein